MQLKIRTIYFKSKNIQELKEFYNELFDIQPKAHKDDEEWIEYDFGNINLGLLQILEEWSGSACVPVFEFSARRQVLELKKKVIELGGNILLEDHDGHTSAVCQDPQGNEFEITNFHDLQK